MNRYVAVGSATIAVPTLVVAGGFTGVLAEFWALAAFTVPFWLLVGLGVVLVGIGITGPTRDRGDREAGPRNVVCGTCDALERADQETCRFCGDRLRPAPAD